MSKASLAKKAAKNKKAETGLNIVSFIGGLFFVSIVVVITVIKDEQLSQEVSRQVKIIATASKELVNQASALVKKVQEINNLLHISKGDLSTLALKPALTSSGVDTEDSSRSNSLTNTKKDNQEYDAFWDTF